MTTYGKDVFAKAKPMFDLAISANVLTMGMAGALAVSGMLSQELYDNIATFEDDQQKNQDKADKTTSLAMASYWVGILVFWALSILIGYTAGKGPDALQQKSSKVANYFQQAFAFIAFILIFATCGTGMTMYDSAATFGSEKPTSNTATTSSAAYRPTKVKSVRAETTSTSTEDADNSEKKATAYYNTFIGFIVTFSILFGIYMWYIVKYSQFAPLKAGGATTRMQMRAPFQGGRSAAVAVAQRPTFSFAPAAVSEFFTY